MFNLADYSLSMSPAERQSYMAQVVRGRSPAVPSPELAAAHQRSTAMDMPAIVAAMSSGSNPQLLQAAMLAQKLQSSQAPKQMGNQGFMVPQTGEFVESPIFSANREDTQQYGLDKQRTQIEASDRRASEANLLRRTLADQRDRTQREIASIRLGAARERSAGQGSAAADDKANNRIDTDVAKLAAYTDKRQVPRLVTSARKLTEIMGRYTDDKIPGLSTQENLIRRVPGGDRMISPEAQEVMSAVQGIANALMRADAGLSQTQSEALRQALETFHQPTVSAETRANIIRNHILPGLETSRANALASANQMARVRYRSNIEETGGDTSWMDPLVIPQPLKAAAPRQPTAAPAPAKRRVKVDLQGNIIP